VSKLTAKEKDQMLTDMALQVVNLLKGHGCVREADNVEPPWLTIEDILTQCDIPPSLWRSVKVRALELGYPLTHGYFTGYYIGRDGEQARSVVQQYTTLRGIAESSCETIMAIGRSGKLKDAEKYARLQIGIALADIPKLMAALDMTLPEAAAGVLESGEVPELRLVA